MKRLALLAALALGCHALAGCIPIGARVQNMYAQAEPVTPTITTAAAPAR